MSTLRLKRRRDIGRQKWQFVAVLVTVVIGVSLFAGIVFSLGSTSAISNIIAGYTMTYRRADSTRSSRY